MKFNVVYDPKTFGIALYWTGPMDEEHMPEWLNKHAIHGVLGPILIGVDFES